MQGIVDGKTSVGASASAKSLKGAVLAAVAGIALVCSLACLPQSAPVAYADVTTYKVPVTYKQSDARSMLSMVNEFRTSGSAWYWNSDDATKTTNVKVDALTYDYGLEKVAMQRAAEIAVLFNHVRPNGEWWYTAVPLYGSYSSGENIAAGQSTAKLAFTSWREDSESYDGQGHRRNMLGESYTTIGIGCVEVGYVCYWVQEFGWEGTGAASTTANDSSVNASVPIDSSNISSKSLVPSKTSLKMQMGSKVSLPKTTLRLNVSGSFPFGTVTAVPSSLTWKSGNTKIATISDGKVTGRKVGKTKLTANSDGVSKSVTVTVNPKSTKIFKLTKAKRGFTAKWKKVSGVTGYQVRYSTKKSMKSAKVKTVKGAFKTSLKVGKLKAEKTYYVQVRTYKKTGGNNYYSSWSIVKSVKTKK